MVGGNGLADLRTSYRRVIMFLLANVIQVLLDLLYTCRDYNDEAIVAVNSVRTERLNGFDNSNFSVLVVASGPRLIARTVS